MLRELNQKIKTKIVLNKVDHKLSHLTTDLLNKGEFFHYKIQAKQNCYTKTGLYYQHIPLFIVV